jgi:alcohol dehydrogenase, propanol-preferring
LPDELDAAIIYAPVGELVPAALASVRKGGIVVCAGIHMSDIPSFPYRLLWQERQIVSVANLTRRDGIDFLHSPLRQGSRREPKLIRSTRRTAPWPICGQAGSKARRFCFHLLADR